MAEKFTIVGKAALPLEDGGTVAPIDLAVDLTYVGRADFRRDYTIATVDDVVDLGTLETLGAKGVLVKCRTGSCTIKFNGGTQAWPLAPGGLFLWVNTAVAFPTAAAVSTTGAASVVFVAVG